MNFSGRWQNTGSSLAPAGLTGDPQTSPRRVAGRARRVRVPSVGGYERAE
jgi:hypothetical protein